MRHSSLKWVEARGYAGMSRSRAQGFLGPASREDENLIGILRAMDAELGEAVLLNQLRATTDRIDLAASLSVLNVPISFYYSPDDPLVDATWIESFTCDSDCFQSIPVKGHGHHLLLETPDDMAKHILLWSEL